MLFRVLWWFDALVAAVVTYFFLSGLAHDTITSANAGIWTIMLVGVAAVLFGSRALRAASRPRAAVGMLLVLAIPGFVAALFLVLILTTNPRWN